MQETVGTKILDYFYDASGKPLAVKYRTSENSSPEWYYYALNSRGDVIGLYTPSGNLYCTYTYDVWGNILSVKNANGVEVTYLGSIVHLQSLKYRGYVYDLETGLYYLQSRYYDPVTHRFINVDGLVSTGTGVLGYNMFAYCDNNPCYFKDNGGTRHCEATSVNKESAKNRSISCPNYELRRKTKERNALKNTYSKIFSLLNYGSKGSVSFGVTASAGAGGYISLSRGIAFDHLGNIAIINSITIGGSTPSASISGFRSLSSETLEDETGGLSFQAGLSVDAGASAGSDLSISPNGAQQVSGSCGAGIAPIPFECHVGVTYSFISSSFNVFDFNAYEHCDFLFDLLGV